MDVADLTVNADFDLRLGDLAKSMGRQLLDEDAAGFVYLLAKRMESAEFVYRAIEVLNDYRKSQGWHDCS